jgi:hypothetical protein
MVAAYGSCFPTEKSKRKVHDPIHIGRAETQVACRAPEAADPNPAMERRVSPLARLY